MFIEPHDITMAGLVVNGKIMKVLQEAKETKVTWVGVPGS
jgi:hypothetical protein